jgi:hypothetical protein
MKRRKFIVIAAATATAIGVPLFLLRKGGAESFGIVEAPQLLSQICKNDELREIGKYYKEVVAKETDTSTLSESLFTDQDGKLLSADADATTTSSFLEKKIMKDFEDGRTVVTKGWVISVTEAQQCALYAS